MANFETTEWGRSLAIVRDCTDQNGNLMNVVGVNYIDQYETVELHTHDDGIEEEYIPQTENLKIIVLPADMMETITDDELMDMFVKSKPVPVGEIIMCHKGEAHALYNDSATEGEWIFIKYQR